jgi:hypothetical protein
VAMANFMSIDYDRREDKNITHKAIDYSQHTIFNIFLYFLQKMVRIKKIAVSLRQING